MIERKIPFKITFSISPALLSMWKDPLLNSRALRHQEDLAALLRAEEKRLGRDSRLGPVVEMYSSKLKENRRKFKDQYRLDLSRGFLALQKSGHAELMTCAATHGYLPLLGIQPEAVRAQVAAAIQLHESCFGEKPRGFWLPECGYQPGMEEILRSFGLRYFFIDTHGLLHSTPRPRYGIFAPASCPNGTAVFARDMESSKQVWSSKEGYPGDPAYRDFYRDIGFDLDEKTLDPFVKPQGLRRFTGLKYYRVTGPGSGKEPYDPEAAARTAERHAAHFLDQRIVQMERAMVWMDRPPHLACLYDAELFGHWWYEGPDFIFNLFQENRRRGEKLQFITPSEYLGIYPQVQKIQPAASSWGAGGYSEFWLNEKNDWIYPRLQQACGRMVENAEKHPQAKGLLLRALNQAARELLLAQSSDWAFMMKTGNHRSYAESRVTGHLRDFHRLQDQIEEGGIESAFLSGLEGRNNLFPGIDYRNYRIPLKKS